MMCLSCRQQITDNITECPFCHAHYNAEKLRFIKYIGDEDSLVGYQKSYKLILLKTIFEFLRSKQQLSVDDIMCEIKKFYLNRVRKGLVADYDVDERIQNISENTTIYAIWAVFKSNPYNVINNQGFLFLEKNSRGELIFVLSNDIVSNLSIIECENIIELLGKKICLYYSKYSVEYVPARTMLDTNLHASQNQSSVIGIEQKPCPLEIERVDVCKIRIDHTHLSVRSKNSLMRQGYNTVGDILNLTEEELLCIRNLGHKSVEEICEFIAQCRTGISVVDESIYNEKEKIEDVRLDCKLQNTNLSTRAKKILEREGYKIVGDIVGLSEKELFAFQNVEPLSVREIFSFIKWARGMNGMEQTNDDESVLLQSIKTSELSVRSKNALASAGYQVVGDILDLTEPELWNLPNIGINSVEEILQFSITLKQKLADDFAGYEQQRYQSIKYPYSNISSECEDVPIIVMSYFGMKPSLIRKLQGSGIYKLGQLKRMDYFQIQIAMGSEWTQLLHFTLQEFNQGPVVATESLLGSMSKEEDLSYIVERSRGATLQEIANKRNMTREGIRQNIEKPLKYIKPMAVCLAKALIKSHHAEFLTLQDVYDVYDNDEYDAIISYALKESEDIETIEALGLYLIKGNISYNDLLSSAVQEYVGEGVFWHHNISTLIEILQERNISFVELDDVWLYMLSMGYRIYGEYVAPRAVSYGSLLAIIIDEEFATGISFSDADAIAKLRQRAFTRFGDLDLPENDRPLISRLIDHLVLCDRGKWISPNRIAVDVSTIETIKEFIDQSEENIIYYQALFNQFKGLLAMTSDIDNYHYLHGVLKFYYGGEYSFNRDYLEKDGAINGSLSKRIYEYIAQKGEAVSKNELKEYLKLSSEVMISNVINTTREIFQWEFNYYNCTGNVSITSIEVQLLHDIIEELFAANQNYCSAKLVYDYCSQLMPDFIKRNRVKNATNLFYLVATIIGDQFKFRIPHILPRGSMLSTTEDIARMFIADSKRLSKNEFNALSDTFGWGRSTAGAIFDNITNCEYYRLSKTEYVRIDEFNVPEIKILEIKRYLDIQMTNRQYIGAWEIEYRKLPEISYAWTPYLFEAIVRNYIKEYRIIMPNYMSNKIERGLYVFCNSKFHTFDEIVVSVLQESGYARLTENEMFTLLVLSGVIKNSIPNELKESKLLSYDDGVYKIKESV